MKCVKCNQKKGRRLCPALGASICPHCCGEKRVSEIPCTPDCAFLSTGQAFALRKKFLAMFDAEPDPRRRDRILETARRYHKLLGTWERVIVEYAANLAALTDRDVCEAIELLEQTYATESRGVIYQPASANPLSQALMRELHTFIEQQREQAAEEGYTLPVSGILDCLEVFRVEIQHHLHGAARGREYLSLVSRNHPQVIRDRSSGGIIVSTQ